MNSLPFVTESDDAFDGLPSMTLVPLNPKVQDVDTVVIVPVDDIEPSYQLIVMYTEESGKDPDCDFSDTVDSILQIANDQYGFVSSFKATDQFKDLLK